MLKSRILARELRSTLCLFLATSVCSLLAVAANAANFEVKISSDGRSEQQDRYVDAAALSAKKKAITTLIGLIKRYQGTNREAALLSRLAIIYQEDAAILFRLAHGKAQRTKANLNLAAYKKEMENSIQTIDTLLRKYPRYSEAGKLFFLRGKAFEEIGKKDLAKKDYLFVIKNFQELPEIVLAYMSLAQFAIDDNQHALALQYLKPIEDRDQDPHYPFALYKSAWCHYNLGNIPKALSYLEKHIVYYDVQPGQESALENSDQAIRESSLNDATLFYADGYEKGISGYQPSNALSYFKKLEKGPYLGKMFVRFAKLLRSHAREKELIDWKNEIIREEYLRPEAVDVAITAFDYQLNQRKFKQVVETANDFVTLFKEVAKTGKITKEQNEAFNTARELLLNTGKEIQALSIKNKASTRVGELSAPLVGVYEAFIRMVSQKDPRVPGVHHNLAETLFEVGQFEESTQHYRWIVNHWKKDIILGKTSASLQEVKLKSISSRYRHLMAKSFLPKELQVKSFKDNSSKEISPLIQEWISWIDDHREKYKPSTPVVDNFYFEANRTLYSNAHIEESVKRMHEFVIKNPGTKYSIPSAMLVVDTHVKTENWEKTHEVAMQFMNINAWADKEAAKTFREKLVDISSSAAFKVIEFAYKDDKKKEVIEKVETFAKTFPKSSKLEDVLFIAGKAASEIGEKEKSEEFFSELIQKFPKSENTAAAFLARALQEEERYEFAHAAEDYQRYLGLYQSKKDHDTKKVIELKRTVLNLQWLAGDYAVLAKTIRTQNFCEESFSEDCNRYQALIAFDSVTNPDSKIKENPLEIQKQAMAEALRGPSHNRAIWAAIALHNQKDLSMNDRMLFVRIISGNWSNLDKLVQLSLLQSVSETIPKAFELNRVSINLFAKVRADAKSIKHRVELIKEVEETSTQAMKMPFAKVRAGVLYETALLYLNLAEAVSAIKTPANLPEDEKTAYKEMVEKLVFPFEEKGHEIEKKAFEIASKFAVEDPMMTKISTGFFLNNPSQAKATRTEVEVKNYPTIDFNTLVQFDEPKAWDAIQSRNISFYKNPNGFLRLSWAQALKEKKWHQAGFFVREAKNKKLWSDASLNFAQALSLAQEGARAESIAILDELRDHLMTDQRNRLTVFLTGQFVKSFAKEKTKKLLQELEEGSREGHIISYVKNDEEAFYLALGSIWSDAKINFGSKRALLQDAANISNNDYRSWARKALNELSTSRAIASEKTPKPTLTKKKGSI